MPIPSYLLTGLLGSGKTTVLRALLAQAPAGSRPAVLVNDFGTVGIDAAVLAGAGGAGEITVREVGGGCVCCTAAASLRAAIPALLRAARPDRLYIEPSGLAAPAAIVDLLREPALRGAIELRAVIGLVDPRRLDDERLLRAPLLRAQLELADVLLATHADVASPAQLERFRAFASTLYPPRAHIGAIAHGDFDPQWLKDITRAAQPGWRLTRSQPLAARAEHGWTFAPEVIFAAPKLTALFAGIGRDGPLAPVERAKGVLRTGRDWRLFDAVAGGGLTVSDVSWRRDSRIECIAFEDARPDWTAIGAAWLAARGEAGAEGGQQGGQ